MKTVVANGVKKGDVLFWITAESPLRILFTVPDSAMAAFPAGALLTLTTPSYPDGSFVAQIIRKSIFRCVRPPSRCVCSSSTRSDEEDIRELIDRLHIMSCEEVRGMC